MDSSTLQLPQQDTLTDLADKINAQHIQAEGAMNIGLGHALEAGRLLELAKKQCQHGTWIPWLRENFKGSKRTAQAYLRLHREYPKLKRKAHRVALLSFRQALVNVANDTQIVAKSEHPDEVIDVWEKQQCQNARRAAASAEVHRTTHTPRLVSTPSTQTLAPLAIVENRKYDVDCIDDEARRLANQLLDYFSEWPTESWNIKRLVVWKVARLMDGFFLSQNPQEGTA